MLVPLISAKFLGDDEQAGLIAVKTGKTKAPKRPEPDAPTGWLTVDQALSWIAARSLAPNWDVAFYFGAATWFSQTPDEALEHLRQMIAEPSGSLFRAARYGPDFEERVRTAVVDLGLLGDDGATHPQTADLDDITGRLIDHLSAHLQDARAQHDRLRQAADILRQAIASGELPAYGWKGYGPESEWEPVLDPRERIPADACAGPVTITGAGIVPVTQVESRSRMTRLIWSGLLFASDDVLRLWPTSTASFQPGPIPSPAAVPAETAPPTQHRYNLAALSAWYLLRVKTWPRDQRGPTEEQDWEDARAAFVDHVPRREIRAIRREKAPENWRKSGPRKRH